MGSNIALPELDVTKPQPAPYPNALEEFQRAAGLQQQAAQTQQTQAQTQGVQQQNQIQAMQLKDEQTFRSLAPQFVQKDENGKITGMDNEGLYAAMKSQGADPTKRMMANVELQKSLIGLSDSKQEQLQKIHGTLFNAVQNVQDAQDKSYKPPTAQPTILNASGMPSTRLPNAPPSQGGPEQAAPVDIPKGQRPLTPEAQMAYHQQVLQIAQTLGPQAAMSLPPMVHNES